MNWNHITSLNDLHNIDTVSALQPVVIFKHSTRCSISVAALDRVQRKWESAKGAKMEWYFLDLIKFREISNEIAARYNVRHESPQVLVIKKGECVYHESHYGVQYQEIVEQINHL